MTGLTVTPGLRVMLWATPLLTTYLGLGYLLGDARRFQATAYTPAKALLPMHWWGVVFIVLGLVNIGLLASGRRRPAMVAICVGLGLYVFWTVVFASALLVDARTTPSAPAYPALVASLHVAMLMTLTGPRRP